MDTILQILVIIILTVFEGVFVAAEIALVTIRRTRVDQLAEEGNRAAKRVKGLVAQPGRFLAVASPAVNPTGGLQELSEGSGLPVISPSAEPLALIIVTLVLSLFTIVFGELVPKSLALAHTETFALRLSGFIEVLLRLLGPLVRVLTAITHGI